MLIRHDLRLEKSYGIFAAYGFVILTYLTILYAGRDVIPRWVVALIIYTDPTVLGFFFLGGLMMLEKSESVREALAMTATSATEYILSKYLTLTGIALLAVFLLAFVAGNAHYGLLLMTVIPASLFFVSLGVLIARRKQTVSGYLLGSLPVVLPVVLPMFLVLLDPFPIWLTLIPSTAQFWLILLAFGEVSGNWAAILFAMTITWLSAAILFRVAVRDLETEFGRK